jgi:acyl-CoA synthetase (NDP forming)
VPQETHDRLFAVLGEIPTISNPLDYHTFIWGDGPKTTEVFSAMLAAYDAGIYIIDSPRADRCDPSGYQPAFDAIVAAQKATGRIALPVALIAENFGEARVDAMMKEGVCALLGLETALAAIKAAQTPAGVPGWRPAKALSPRETRMLSEAEGKALLAEAGVKVPQSRTAACLSDLSTEGLTPPFALKGLGFAHKTEAGAVRLGLTSLQGQAEMSGATGYLVEEMVTGAVAEILLGLQRDPVYGVTLTLGMGGVTAEVLADTVTLVLPATETQVLDAMRGLRLWPLLDGYRGRPKADMAAVAQIAVALGQRMLADQTLEEIEINPILVRAVGAVAVDALIRKV